MALVPPFTPVFVIFFLCCDSSIIYPYSRCKQQMKNDEHFYQLKYTSNTQAFRMNKANGLKSEKGIKRPNEHNIRKYCLLACKWVKTEFIRAATLRIGINAL